MAGGGGSNLGGTSTGAGSLITLTNVGVTSQSFGFLAQSGGQVQVDGGSITTLDNSVSGLVADGTGSGISMTGGQITTQGLLSNGVLAADNGTVTLNGSSIATNGSFSTGVLARFGGSVEMAGSNTVAATAGGLVAMGSPAVIDATQSTHLAVTVGGVASDGILMSDGGLVRLPSSANNSTTVITMTGDNGTGISVVNTSAGAIGSGITVNLDGTVSGTGLFAATSSNVTVGNLLVQGAGGTAGVISQGGSNVTLNGPSSITISGGTGNSFSAHAGGVITHVNGVSSAGLFATDGSITGTDTSILVTSQFAAGAAAISNGSIALTGGSITATGNESSGVVSSSGATVTLNAVPVTTTGTDAVALEVDGRGHLTVMNSAVSAQGAGASFGLLATGGTAANPDVVTISGGSLRSLQSTAIEAETSALNVSLSNGVQVIGGGGLALNAIGSSTVNLLADSSSLTGAMLTDATSISNVTLQNGTIWNMTGSSNVTSLTNNDSLVAYSPPTGDPTLLSSYKTLTAMNYLGQGGTLGLNTFLGADGSPSDRLVINGGTATGASLLRIANAGGAGALTTGNGILVVDTMNGGATAAGAFALAARVDAGPYEYTLFRSSVDATNPQAWYLRSTLDCTLAPNVPACQTPVPPTPSPPTPEIPDYRPETSLYATLPSMVLQYGRNLMDTLHERVGEERPGIAPADGNNPQPSLGWARVITLSGFQAGSPDGIFGKGPQYNYGINAFQGGIDLYRAERADGGSDHAGVYTAIGQMSANVTHFTGLPAGSNTLNAYTLGGYWTRFGATGWYLDAVAQYTWNDLKAVPIGISGLTTHGGSFAASLEAGKPFQLGGGYSIEPQAQLMYQTASLTGSSDSAASVVFSDVDSLVGRLGARLSRSFAIDPDAAQPHVITAWLRPSVWYEFLGNPTTSFSSATGLIPFRSDLGGGWGEILAGFDVQVARNASFYASASYQIGFDGKSDAYGGKFGARVTW